MNYFLVQISNMGIYMLLAENKYLNDRWGITGKEQQFVTKEDYFIIYFTSSISKFRQQIKYIFQVIKISDDKKNVFLKSVTEVKSINLHEIRELIVRKQLSEKFTNCSRHGFNICKVSQEDFNVILERKINEKTNVQDMLESYKNKVEILKMNEKVQNELERQSDKNLLYMHKNNIKSIDKKEKKRLQKLGYINVIKNKIEITPKGENLIK